MGLRPRSPFSRRLRRPTNVSRRTRLHKIAEMRVFLERKELRRLLLESLSVSSVVIPDKRVSPGTLIAATSFVWAEIVNKLKLDWSLAQVIPPHTWEEIIAGAFQKAGFDEVILTPRSGDHGRDVIAVRRGLGCIKVINSVKAYKPGRLVTYDDIRALLGVLSGERDASKGIITTTSGFPPKVTEDPFIGPFLPTRLELMDGETLRNWLADLSKN